MADKKNNPESHSETVTDNSLEFDSMKKTKAVGILDIRKQDLEIALSTAIEHGDIVEEQLYLVNDQLQKEVNDRRQAEEALQRLVQTINQQKSDLEIALSTAIEHGDAIEEQLYEVNNHLHSEIGERQNIENKLQSLVGNLSRQKNDLEVLVETIASHGDEINLQMEQQLSSIEIMAKTDALTGLWNRRSFDESLETEWNRNGRAKTPLSLLVLDIDHFKLFNDAFGHQAGDECLKKVASELMNIPRRSGELAARYGGEEFVILMPITDLANAFAMAEYIRQSVENLKIEHPETDNGYVTVSIGVASMIPVKKFPAMKLFERADANLYLAKRSGRNRIGTEK